MGKEMVSACRKKEKRRNEGVGEDRATWHRQLFPIPVGLCSHVLLLPASCPALRTAACGTSARKTILFLPAYCFVLPLEGLWVHEACKPAVMDGCAGFPVPAGAILDFSPTAQNPCLCK